MNARKLCTSRLHRGPRWLPMIYFDVKVWGDKSHTWVAQYQSWCKTCHKVYSRHRKAIRQGRDPDKTEPRNGGMTKAERKRRKAAEFQRRMADPEARKELRQRQREASAARRREAGIPERGGWKRYRANQKNKSQVLDAEPFLTWLDQFILETAAEISENEQRMIFRVRESQTITVVQADRLMVSLGRPEILSVLYEV